jgi:cell division protease FtsH
VLPGKQRRRRAIFIAAAILIVLCGLYVFKTGTGPDAHPTIAFSEFLRHAESGDVASVIIGESSLDAVLRDGRDVRTIMPPGFASSPEFISGLVQQNAQVHVRPTSDPSAYQIGPILMLLAFVALVGFTIYRTTAGRIPSLGGKARVADRNASVVTFADVAGVDEAKDEVKEIVDFLREPQRYSAIGGRIPKGVLLVGPPGTGKTLLARSISGEAGVPFIFASGADFVEMYAGVGAARVRRLFREAHRHKACIVFIDELDAVGRMRGGNSLSHEEREQTLNQLLVEMDGFEPHHGTVVVAATNRQDILDPALLRPGRFDRQVVVGNPDLRGREAILRVHARKVALAQDADLRRIARGTPGFSGADLANLINEAALLAGRASRTTITTADLEAARDKVMMGVERRSVLLSEQDRINCAYHEAGHAVVAALLPKADPLHKVTIIPRGRAMGVTMQLPEADRHTYTKDYLETQIAILMGGRVAEELFMNHMTSGASNDIERATEIAQRMVCDFGMSPLGPRAFRRPAGSGWEGERGAGLAEGTALRVDEEISRLVMDGYDHAMHLLQVHRGGVDALAQELLRVESLDADEIRAVLAGAGVAIVSPAILPSNADTGQAPTVIQ